jgi:hypothetical protein
MNVLSERGFPRMGGGLFAGDISSPDVDALRNFVCFVARQGETPRKI